ncbi:type IV toxin-antitoxin system AbiEi family antitoxin domain-containing protein, partial [Phytoactinopolyspora endophytica]|uniref:type IV toxin-antitoxin system AbiEi family antitoxin domain-containing protein n=1 Tax=Phytoactinopolyspora endophytica TaxID=1642495 RepID=UPI0013E9F0FA
MRPDDHALLERTLEKIVREQEGVFRLDQIAPLVTWATVDHAVRSGRWSRPHRGVYVLHNGELTESQEHWICVLAASPGAALGGLTAAKLDGLQGFEVPERYLVVPIHARAPRRSGLIVKRSSLLTDADVHPMRRPPRTRVPRSLVDGASWQATQTRSRAIVLAGVQQGLARPADLRDALSRRGPCRHRRLITQSIDDAEGGIASVPERDFEQIRRRFHLPEPERQAVVRGPDGRFYLDAYWSRYDVSAEIHGTQHMEILSWDADLDRQAILAAGGKRVLPFTSYAVRSRKEHVGAILTEALRNAGWSGKSG